MLNISIIIKCTILPLQLRFGDDMSELRARGEGMGKDRVIEAKELQIRELRANIDHASNRINAVC